MKPELKAIIAVMMCLCIFASCEDKEIVREAQITEDILNDVNYVGRLPEHPDRKERHLYYYNTKELCFYECRWLYISTGKSGYPVLRWRYIALDTLKNRVAKQR